MNYQIRAAGCNGGLGIDGNPYRPVAPVALFERVKI